MLEAVALIGRALAEGDDPVADRVKPPPPKPPGIEKTYLVKLDFCPGGCRPLAVKMQEMDEEAALSYRWVGNEKGNRPQICLTTDQLRYLVGQAPVNLLARLEEAGLEGGGLYRRLSALVNSLFRPLPDGSRVLDPQRAGLTSEDVITAALAGEGTGEAKPRERARAAVEAVTQVVRKWALEQLGLKTTEVALWTVLVDGVPLAADPDYARVLLRSKEEAVQKGERGVCSVCGAADRPVTADFTQLEFLKYYINDKLGAASGVAAEGFARNFQACRDCFRGLLLAERFAQGRLNLRVGRLSFLVLPAFLRDLVLTRDDLEFWAERLRRRVGPLADYWGWLESTRALEEELEGMLDELPEENAALLNFLFYSYQAGRSEFRVLALAKDVAPSRIASLVRRSRKLAREAEQLLGPDRWWLDLAAVYRLIPLSEGPRGGEYKKLLHGYHSLLTGVPLERAFLIGEFVALARVYKTGSHAGTNVPQPKAGAAELDWAHRLMQANLFLKFLREENLLQGGMSLGAVPEQALALLPGEMRAYLTAMGYSGPEAALFLLGYLLNQVGQKQWERGYENKPVLEKVNYAGMPWAKVVRLANIVVDQLRQHDIWKYNEGIFAVLKELLDAQRPGTGEREWPLSPEENVFYILSGYAYGTRLALKARWSREPGAGGDNQEGGSE